MKKLVVVFAFLAVGFCVYATSGEVLAIKGKVEIQKGGQWTVAQKGDMLDSGTLVSTGFKSELT